MHRYLFKLWFRISRVHQRIVQCYEEYYLHNFCPETNLTLQPPVPILFVFPHFLLADCLSAFKHVENKIDIAISNLYFFQI